MCTHNFSLIIIRFETVRLLKRKENRSIALTWKELNAIEFSGSDLIFWRKRKKENPVGKIRGEDNWRRVERNVIEILYNVVRNDDGALSFPMAKRLL